MRKLLLGILAVVLVLGIAAVAGEWFVRGRIVAQIVDEVSDLTGTEPEVTLDSFPVLLDLARGSIPAIDGSADTLELEGFAFEQVEVHAADIRTRGARSIAHLDATAASVTIEGMELLDISVQARDVELETVRLGTLTAEALLPGASIEAAVRQQVGEDITVNLGEGSVHVGLETIVGELLIGFTPELIDGGLALMPVEFTLGTWKIELADLPFGIDDQITAIPVELPLGPLTLQSVTLTAAGARVALSGADVSLEDFAR